MKGKNILKLNPEAMRIAVQVYLNTEVFQYNQRVTVESISYSRKDHKRGEYTVKIVRKVD